MDLQAIPHNFEFQMSSAGDSNAGKDASGNDAGDSQKENHSPDSQEQRMTDSGVFSQKDVNHPLKRKLDSQSGGYSEKDAKKLDLKRRNSASDTNQAEEDNPDRPEDDNPEVEAEEQAKPEDDNPEVDAEGQAKPEDDNPEVDAEEQAKPEDDNPEVDAEEQAKPEDDNPEVHPEQLNRLMDRQPVLNERWIDPQERDDDFARELARHNLDTLLEDQQAEAEEEARRREEEALLEEEPPEEEPEEDPFDDGIDDKDLGSDNSLGDNIDYGDHDEDEPGENDEDDASDDDEDEPGENDEDDASDDDEDEPGENDEDDASDDDDEGEPGENDEDDASDDDDEGQPGENDGHGLDDDHGQGPDYVTCSDYEDSSSSGGGSEDESEEYGIMDEGLHSSRSGKAQLAHTLCVSTQLPINLRGGNGKVAYIDTEGTLLRMDLGAVLDKHQYKLLLGLAAKMAEEPFRLLIVDSDIALFRVEDFTGRELAERQQKLAQMLSRLMKIAEEFNVAVYMTNQVIADPGCGVFISDPKKANVQEGERRTTGLQDV